MTLFIILLILIFVIVSYLVTIYNSLVGLRNQVKNAWSQIDVQLKRRHDLIPNLLETVKGYMKHERETLEEITNARAKAVGAEGIPEKSSAESLLTSALGKFNLVVENYPELKADKNFILLQEELTSTENKISFARQNYNDQVLFYNNKIQMFPSNVIAGMFNFKLAEFFELKEKSEKEVPKIDFSK